MGHEESVMATSDLVGAAPGAAAEDRHGAPEGAPTGSDDLHRHVDSGHDCRLHLQRSRARSPGAADQERTRTPNASRLQ